MIEHISAFPDLVNIYSTAASSTWKHIFYNFVVIIYLFKL